MFNSTCVSGYCKQLQSSACVAGKNSRNIAAHLEAALPLTKHGILLPLSCNLGLVQNKLTHSSYTFISTEHGAE